MPALHAIRSLQQAVHLLHQPHTSHHIDGTPPHRGGSTSSVLSDSCSQSSAASRCRVPLTFHVSTNSSLLMRARNMLLMLLASMLWRAAATDALDTSVATTCRQAASQRCQGKGVYCMLTQPLPCDL